MAGRAATPLPCGACAGRPPGELDRLVGDAPQPRRHRQGAVGRPRRDAGRDQPAGPRHPPGPGRGGRRASTSSWCSAATARSTRRPTGWPAPAARWPPLPGGSTNVFARTIGLPNDPIEATGVLLDALARRSIRRVGLGSVNGRYFLFHTGVGFDAAVVEQVERRSGLKRYAGHPLFVYAGFDTWIRHYDRSRPRLAGAPRRRLGGRRRLPHDRPQHQPLHLPRQPAARPRPRGDARPGPGGGDACGRWTSPGSSASSARRSAAGGRCAAAAGSTCAPTSRR